MSYVDRNLITGEQVVYRATLYRLPYLWCGLPLVGALGAAVFHVWFLAGALVLSAVGIWASISAKRAAAQFAVTNSRVIIAVGVARRRTLELMLTKIGGISVEQSLGGRMFDFGTVTITGSGGTREAFDNIASPLEFRRQVQSQLALVESRPA
jgi:uncharacterized membrane protein YdbT with pleckstrin-like domain